MLVLQASDRKAAAATAATCHNRVRLFRRAKIKSIKISALIVSSFLLCWTPYYVAYLMGTMEEKQKEQKKHMFFFGQFSSLLNPIIYGIFHYRSAPSRTE